MLLGLTMRLRVRLDRLEKHATNRHGQAPARDLFPAIKKGRAWLRGEGLRPPDPPCRHWFDPAEWASRMRISRCLDERMKCDLRNGGYLPDKYEEKRRYVDGLLHVFATFTVDQTDAT
jgi:hypothetical protein